MFIKQTDSLMDKHYCSGIISIFFSGRSECHGALGINRALTGAEGSASQQKFTQRETILWCFFFLGCYVSSLKIDRVGKSSFFFITGIHI